MKDTRNIDPRCQPIKVRFSCILYSNYLNTVIFNNINVVSCNIYIIRSRIIECIGNLQQDNHKKLVFVNWQAQLLEQNNKEIKNNKEITFLLSRCKPSSVYVVNMLNLCLIECLNIYHQTYLPQYITCIMVYVNTLFDAFYSI